MKPPDPCVLPDPCPRCGAQVMLRQWEGQYYAKCQGSGCLFGFDADKRGKPAFPCPSCGTGRLRTTAKGRVCADCGKWDNNASGPGVPSLGACPACKTGRLSVIKGEYGHFAGCSNPLCDLTYTCDETGRPEGGFCKRCKGPVKKTRSGSRICLACETWQDPRPAQAAPGGPRPPGAACPVCREPLRVVLTRRKQWVYRCDACRRWVEVKPGEER